MEERRFYTNPKDEGLLFPRRIRGKVSHWENEIDKEEHEIQTVGEELCKNYGFSFFRIPDAIYFAIKYHPDLPDFEKKQMLQYIEGFPDLMPILPKGDFNVCQILEIKTERGKLSKSQRKFRSRGLKYELARGIKQTKEKLMRFFENAGS
jgi:hypothetical protein